MTNTKNIVSVGDHVKLTASIYDHGEDHHPPGWLAMKGEVLVVRAIIGGATGQLAVSHEDVTDNAFCIVRGEYEPHNGPLQGRAACGESLGSGGSAAD